MSEKELYNTALNKAMNLCSLREYCILDIRDKLKLWGVTGNNAEKIIISLVNENFINELRYAKAFTNDKFNYNKWGKVKISAHLRAKNIQGDIINQALANINNELYLNTLKNLMAEHRRFIKAKNQYDFKAKMLRYGSSKGFESGLLYDLLNDIDD